jgi:excisionase family DNA binding protein
MQANSPPRFLALAEVAEVLSISVSQVYALVRRGELPAIKIGGRGQWRVESSELESFIADAYRSTRQFIADHPFVGDEGLDPEAASSGDEPADPEVAGSPETSVGSDLSPTPQSP